MHRGGTVNSRMSRALGRLAVIPHATEVILFVGPESRIRAKFMGHDCRGQIRLAL